MPRPQRKEGKGGPTQRTQSWERVEWLPITLIHSFHHLIKRVLDIYLLSIRPWVGSWVNRDQ